ncbi:MAG TPA: phosphonate ABC transporter permease [Ruminococcaceae bacterium]|nr:phosphonate ABC transporter permease [Oscillospiraceae bacterium]
MNRQRNVSITASKLLVGVFFLAAVVLPLFNLLVNLKDADFQKIFSNPAVGSGILHSALVSLCAAAISVVLALALAWCMARTNIKLKSLFRVLITLPMLVPSISHGMGLVILFGSNGKLTRFFGMSQGIYGFWGIVAGSVMYSFPVAFLMLYDILQYENAAPYEAARVLGIPKLKQFTAITLPFLRKPLINVIFATFTMIVTDYGVPLMIGGTYKTLPVIMYEEVIGRLDYSKGAVFGSMLLVPAVAAFFIDMFCKNRTGGSNASKPFEIKKSVAANTFSYVFLALVSAAVVYPILSFAQLTFANKYPIDMTFTMHNIQSTVNKGALDFLGNSVFIAAAVSLLGTAAAFISAYFTSRLPSKGSSVLHMLSIISLAIPGMVLGLSYIFTFKGSFIYGTFAILILVNSVHFFSSPYLMFYNSMGKISGDLEAVGATLGIGRLRMIRDVFLPQLKSTVLESITYFFVNSMMTISAVAFLAGADTKPLSLMINQFEAQTLLEAAAFVSLMILGVNLCLKGVIALIRRFFAGRRNKAGNQ